MPNSSLPDHFFSLTASRALAAIFAGVMPYISSSGGTLPERPKRSSTPTLRTERICFCGGGTYSFTETADDVMLLCGDDSAGLASLCDNELAVERLNGMDVDNSCVDALCCERCTCLEVPLQR